MKIGQISILCADCGKPMRDHPCTGSAPAHGSGITSPLWALRYMIGHQWLWVGTLRDDLWKKDPELVRWLEKGWVEMDSQLGFRITKEGVLACQNDKAE